MGENGVVMTSKHYLLFWLQLQLYNYCTMSSVRHVNAFVKIIYKLYDRAPTLAQSLNPPLHVTDFPTYMYITALILDFSSQ